MKYFRYIGDPAHGGDGPEIVECHGHRFVKGSDPVQVSDAHAMMKLDGSSHFVRVDGRTMKKKKNADES